MGLLCRTTPADTSLKCRNLAAHQSPQSDGLPRKEFHASYLPSTGLRARRRCVDPFAGRRSGLAGARRSRRPRPHLRLRREGHHHLRRLRRRVRHRHPVRRQDRRRRLQRPTAKASPSPATSPTAPSTPPSAPAARSSPPSTATADASRASPSSPTARSSSPATTAKATDFAVARYLTNGTLDTTFGSLGKTVTTFGGYGGSKRRRPPIRRQDRRRRLPTANSEGFAVARYLTNGTLDTSFGSLGKTVTTFDGYGGASAVALQSDGKIVVAGYNGQSEGFAVARYLTNGTLDTSFGSPARPITDLRRLRRSKRRRPPTDGKIVVAGYNGQSEDFAVARYLTDGTLDTSFGSLGKTVTTFDGYGGASAVALQADGKIVVAGYNGQQRRLRRRPLPHQRHPRHQLRRRRQDSPPPSAATTAARRRRPPGRRQDRRRRLPRPTAKASPSPATKRSLPTPLPTPLPTRSPTACSSRPAERWKAPPRPRRPCRWPWG